LNHYNELTRAFQLKVSLSSWPAFTVNENSEYKIDSSLSNASSFVSSLSLTPDVSAIASQRRRIVIEGAIMKITCSVASLALCISASALTGCVSDQSTASSLSTSEWNATANSSPSGIWLINSHMTDDVNSAGNEFYTEATSRQLVVIEDLGNDQYQLHECSLAANGSYPATPLEFHASGLQAASSFTDYNSRTPYNESEKVEIRLEGKELHGMIAYYDRNLDGSYDGRQVSYMTGMKVSEAQTLDLFQC
jgi:hypothetical protein